MEWSKLDLRKAAVLKKEVDVALVALSKVQAANDNVKKEILVMSIQSRIDDLESFCTMHDADDRTVLFEKQQLRLRKAIQALNFYPPSAPSHSVALPASPSPRQQSSERTAENNSPLSLSALNAPQSPAKQPTSKAPMKIIGSSNNSSVGGSRGSGYGARPPASRPIGQTQASMVLPQPPTNSIYEWEAKGSNEAAAPKKRLFLDGSSYCPTMQAGMYVKEIRDEVARSNNQQDDEEGYLDSDEQQKPSNGLGEVTGVVGSEELLDEYVDFQIVLTAEEMSALISRRRISSRPDIQLAKSQLVSGNVHISTPYVDQSRIMKAHFRPDNPEKWMDKDGIRPNKW